MPFSAKAAPVRLEHLFLPGLRFDRQLRYQVQGKHRRTWAAVPVQLGSGVQTNTLLPLLQAGLALTQVRVVSDQLRQLSFAALNSTSPRQLVDTLANLALGIHARKTDVAHVWQSAAESQGRTAYLVELEPKGLGASRWAWITGVELEKLEATYKLRSFLMLDPTLPPPWGSGYNARLQPCRSRCAINPLHATWQCLGLDGQVEAVLPRACLELARLRN